MSPSFKSYLNEIARYPLLTVDQEIQYGRRIAKMRELQQLERTLTDAEQRLVRSGQRARERRVVFDIIPTQAAAEVVVAVNRSS